MDNANMTESISQMVSRVRDAWYAYDVKITGKEYSDTWVAEVYDDYIIVERSATYLQVPYSDDGSIVTFADASEWKEVKRQIDWVAKSFREMIKRTGNNILKSITKNDDELIVGNYIVLYGGEDLEGEHFTPATELESEYTKTGVLHVDWEHGMGKAIDGAGPERDDVLGKVLWETAKSDDTGVWVERVLNRRNQYMQYLETLIDEGLVGTSSEAVPGKTIVSKSGEIQKWPLKRDSLTVMPAEPRMMSENAITALKSLVKDFPELQTYLPQEPGDGSSAEVTTEGEEPSKIQPTKNVQIKEVSVMEPKEKILREWCAETGLEYENLNDKQKALAFRGTEFEVKSVDQRIDGLEAKFETLNAGIQEVLEYAKDTPALKNAGYISQDGGSADAERKSFGDFLTAIARKDYKRLQTVYGSRFEHDRGEGKALSEGVGDAGGYTVPEEYENRIVGLSVAQSVVRNAGALVMPVSSPWGMVPSFDQGDAPTAGQGDSGFAAGVVATPVAEGGALTDTNLVFDQIRWTVHKVGGITQASNELINDSVLALETILAAKFAVAVNAKEDYQFFRGTGASEALGIINSGAAIGVTPDANNVWDEGDALEMLSRFHPHMGRGAWFIHPGIIPDLGEFEMGTGGSVYIQNIAGDNPTGMPLLGKPVYQSEHLPQDDNAGCAILADMTAYGIFDLQGMLIAFSEHYAFNTDQGTWRFTKRFDGKPLFNAAVTLADPNGSFTVSPFVYFND